MTSEGINEEDRAAIEREVRAVHAGHVRAAERFDFERMFADYSDACGVGFLHQGMFYPSAEAYRALFDSFIPMGFREQQINFEETRVAVLAPNVALLTAHGGFVAIGPGGKSVERGQVITYVYTKIRQEWKAVHCHKSFPDWPPPE